MNAIDFLVNEHNKVRQIFSEISNQNHREETKKKLFHQLCDELLRHETMEQQIWYPKIKKETELDPRVHHLLQEEKSAERAIKKFEQSDEALWETNFNHFRKEVEHHAAEEETKLFPVVRKLFDEAKLEEIGLEMHRFKQSYNKN